MLVSQKRGLISLFISGVAKSARLKVVLCSPRTFFFYKKIQYFHRSIHRAQLSLSSPNDHVQEKRFSRIRRVSTVIIRISMSASKCASLGYPLDFLPYLWPRHLLRSRKKGNERKYLVPVTDVHILHLGYKESICNVSSGPRPHSGRFNYSGVIDAFEILLFLMQVLLSSYSLFNNFSNIGIIIYLSNFK